MYKVNWLFYCQPEAPKSNSKRMTEQDFVEEVAKSHSVMTSVLSNRNKSLQTVRIMWTSGNTKVTTSVPNTQLIAA